MTNDHLTIEQRLTRLEAWTREEIFARTAMDEPDPDRQPVSDEELADILCKEQERAFHEDNQTAYESLVSGIRAVRAAIAAAKERDHE